MGDQGKAPNSNESDSKILESLAHPSVTQGSHFLARAGTGASLTGSSSSFLHYEALAAEPWTQILPMSTWVLAGDLCLTGVWAW